MRRLAPRVPAPVAGSLLCIGAAPRIAIACPFCASGDVGTGSHYLVATIVMLALPLGLIGGFALWVRHSVRPADPTEGTDPPIPGDPS